MADTDNKYKLFFIQTITFKNKKNKVCKLTLHVIQENPGSFLGFLISLIKKKIKMDAKVSSKTLSLEFGEK